MVARVRRDWSAVRSDVIECVVAAEGLSPRGVASVLELVGPGELELAVDQFLRCTGWRPDELLLGRLLGLARELGVDTEKYLRRWDEREASGEPRGEGWWDPLACRNTELPLDWSQEEVDAYVSGMLEDPRASRYLLTGTLNRPCARNGTPVLCWVSAYPPGVCVVAELATGRVVSRNQVVVDTSPTGTRLHNQLLRAVDNPDLPVFDFTGVLDLISMGEWALALRVLCTQVCETGTHLTPTNLANIQQAGHTLNIDTTTLLQKNPPDVMSKCSAIVTGLRRRVKMLCRSGRAGGSEC